MGSPKKENFLFNYKQVLQKLNFVMGVGGSFDVVAGKVKRAPVWVQKIGMEWFYRMAQEPRRLFMRYFTTNLALIKLILKDVENFGVLENKKIHELFKILYEKGILKVNLYEIVTAELSNIFS